MVIDEVTVPTQPDRFRLVAYVNGKVSHRDMVGTIPLKDIYMNAPEDSHLAVVEVEGAFWLIDLLLVVWDMNNTTGPIRASAYKSFPTEDAAIMAAMMQ